jgi:hypothetical protein
MLHKVPRRRIANPKASAITQWLNRTIGRAGNDRISWLLRTAPKVVSPMTSRDLPHIDYVNLKTRGTQRQMANARKLGRLLRELNKRLSSYKSYPELWVSANGQWHLRWKPLRKHDEVEIVVSLQGDTVPYSEADALQKVLDLAREGKLHRFRKCGYCQRWYFARVRHQGYCGINCQQSNFRTSPRFKHNRKLYMRTYRREEHKRNKQAKIRVCRTIVTQQ